MNKAQLEFTTIINHSFAEYEKRIVAYITKEEGKEKLKHLHFARMISPNLDSDADIYYRIAFAILSANAPFEDSVKALNVAVKLYEKKQAVKPVDLVYYKMVPAKAKYLNRLARLSMQSLRRQHGEEWHEYRMRLKSKVLGLGLAKASFAACLLYPLEADLACVDTWIQKVFLGHSSFKSLGVGDYLLVEAKIRTYAVCFGVSTFIAQWLIWDHARGESNSHDIFPGSHK
jgi:thermostable 8-oxoguanine DNA glycosylase